MTFYLFIVLSLFSLGYVFYYSHWNKNLIVFISLGFLVLSWLSIHHFFEQVDARPPRFIYIFAWIIGYVFLLLKFLPFDSTRLHASLNIHVIRIPVEVGLYLLFKQKLVPIEMTFAGWNPDILVGITALGLLLYAFFTRQSYSKKFLFYWHVFGMLLLINIVTLAILSVPLPFQQIGLQQPNRAVLQFPYIVLPTFIVPLVMVSHLQYIISFWKIQMALKKESEIS